MIITPAVEKLIMEMYHHADVGVFRGSGDHWQPYFEYAKRVHEPTGTMLLFTRDIGHHTSGWWKNPDYERCYHLSLSFWDLANEVPRPFEPKLAKTWVKAFYGDWTRYVWEEGPSQKMAADVRHYRVFCDAQWQPIIPRGEVYTREFTEAGWKSWSDQQYLRGKK